MHFSHWLFNSTFVTCNAFYFYCFSLQSFTVFFLVEKQRMTSVTQQREAINVSRLELSVSQVFDLYYR